MTDLNIGASDQFQNEPKTRKGAQGFLSVPSVGMRLAPEILILELYRDVFYTADTDRRSQTRELRPDLRNEDNELAFSHPERAVISALRGRRKQNRRSSEDPFYAPAYPGLARQAWLSKKRERVIVRLLFEGAFSQHLWSRGDRADKQQKQREVVDLMLQAFLGTPKAVAGRGAHPDVLAAALGDPNQGVDSQAARENLIRITNRSSSVFDADRDDLADRITADFLALCVLEQNLPRLLWLRIMMTYLRLALPIWLMAHMRITCLVHGWLVKALDGRDYPGEPAIEGAFAGRNKDLVRPTLTPTREIFGRIAQCIRCRVELNVLLYCLEKLQPGFRGKEITTRREGAGYIRLVDVFPMVRAAGESLRAAPNGEMASGGQVFLSRKSEAFRAWRDPLNKGQGKNIDEFLRVLYRAERGDEAGGYLLVREGRGDSTGFRVFPGQLLLQTVAFLAAKAKQQEPSTVHGGGKLVLEDIEKHFSCYGIDFSQAADARPQLMSELQALGLLVGSPDAGSSVAVACPF